jgi:hypothetical protein
MMMNWVKEEMSTIDLNDPRLNRRAGGIVNNFARMGDSQPDAFRSKAALDGAYRFMNNPKVSPESLLSPHIERSIERTAKHPKIILVQDTTEIELTKPVQQVDGAGPLDDEEHRGFFLHPLMAYTTQGVPLGLVNNIHWTREKINTTSSPEEKRALCKQRPFEEKESFRWLQNTYAGQQIAEAHPETTYVSVSDSEGDIYEVFASSTAAPENFHLLTRACQNRALVADKSGLSLAVEGNAKTINALIATKPPQFSYDISVRARASKVKGETRKRKMARKERCAQVEVRSCQARLRPPHRAGGKKLPEVLCNIVEVREANPPKSCVPIIWLLVTTLPIDTEEQLREIIQMYKSRWLIELYFRVLKSGMRIEKLKYQKLSRYMNATALLMIVAWRVQMLTQAARYDGQADCKIYLDDNQWKPLHLVTYPGQTLPKVPPCISDCLTMIAVMGGYINKKAQGPPGTQTIWRGLRRLEMLTQAFDAFGPTSE